MIFFRDQNTSAAAAFDAAHPRLATHRFEVDLAIQPPQLPEDPNRPTQRHRQQARYQLLCCVPRACCDRKNKPRSRHPMKKKLRNLHMTLDICGLMISITPFRMARWAFKTDNRFMGPGRSTQLFFGPFHIWTFPSDKIFSLGLDIDFSGSVHGTFTPTGDDALAFFWRWLTKSPKDKRTPNDSK